MASATAYACPASWFPQIYVGGDFVGGATDLFDIGKAGELQARLAASNISYNEVINRDPYSFLPDWLHPR